MTEICDALIYRGYARTAQSDARAVQDSLSNIFGSMDVLTLQNVRHMIFGDSFLIPSVLSRNKDVEQAAETAIVEDSYVPKLYLASLHWLWVPQWSPKTDRSQFVHIQFSSKKATSRKPSHEWRVTATW